MQKRRMNPLRILAAAMLALALLGGGFAGGVAADRVGVLPGTVARASQSTVPGFGVFWEAWGLVQQNYVNHAALNPVEMTYGAIAGMLDSLGDSGHTRFLSPKDLKEEEDALAGKLEGIGAEVGMRDGRPTILAPIPESPAQRAGLRPGDVIVRIDGKGVDGLTLDQVVSLVRGPQGTTVTLTILHRGDATPVDVSVVRAKITVPSVSWARVPGTTVAHVLISQFADHTTDDLATALKAARSGGATAAILDLRNNPGGLRDEAIGVTSQFLREGTPVLLEQDAQGKRTTYSARLGGVALDLPLVVLVNGSTASSSEIVVGALQDHQRASLVGMPTFGTGTVLSTYRLSDGSAILLGTHEWLTPNGRQIWHHGITPDVRVELPADAIPLLPGEEAGLTPEQLRASPDAQLLRALQEATHGAP